MDSFNHKCSHCGVHLELDKDDPLKYCPYCGSELHFESEYETKEETDENVKKTFFVNPKFSNLSDSVIFDSFLGQILKNKVILYSIVGIVSFLVFVAVMAALLSTESRIPFSQNYAKGQQYTSLLTALDNAGFYKFSIVPIKNELYSNEYEDGQVIEVSVNGKNKYSTKKKYNVEKTNIVISFYSPDGKIKLPISSEGIIGQNKRDIEKVLIRYGFSNLTITRDSRLVRKLLYDDGEIISITIDGRTKFEQGERLAPDTSIYIKYFSRL